MKITLQTNSIKHKADGFVVAIFSDTKNTANISELLKSPILNTLSNSDQKFIKEAVAAKNIWHEGEVETLPIPSQPQNRLLIFCLGAKKDWQIKKASLTLRKVINILKDQKISKACLFLDDFKPSQIELDGFIQQAATEFLMADFNFNQYKEVPKEGWPKVDEVVLLVNNISQTGQTALQSGIIIGSEVNHCRQLANTPGGDMTPATLAKKAQEEVMKAGPKLKVNILTESEIKKLKMGGVLGVSRGSNEKPRFIVMEYNSAKDQKPLVFVGKGVTFDTGGLNLKPDSGIYEMHMDMSGGAAVIHAISAICQLKLPVNIIGLIPAVENMPSGSSYHPGDILKTITGKTIEVLNTDAEGRIILADALGYAQKFDPKIVVDLATLTGAAMVALGQRAIALFATDRKTEDLARSIGEGSGDVVWPLPLWDEYFDEIKGTFGDVANIGKNRYGGAITGAIFLKQFIGKHPWLHLDIAPTMTTIEGQNLAKGASGTGVRFLVELAKHYSKQTI